MAHLPYICPYYVPTQPEQPRGTPQEPLQKCLICTLQHRRRKPQLISNHHWRSRSPRTNRPCFNIPHQPRELSKHLGPRSGTTEKSEWAHTQAKNTYLWGIPLCQKIIKELIAKHNQDNLCGIAKITTWPGSTVLMPYRSWITFTNPMVEMMTLNWRRIKSLWWRRICPNFKWPYSPIH